MTAEPCAGGSRHTTPTRAPQFWEIVYNMPGPDISRSLVIHPGPAFKSARPGVDAPILQVKWCAYAPGRLYVNSLAPPSLCPASLAWSGRPASPSPHVYIPLLHPACRGAGVPEHALTTSSVKTYPTGFSGSVSPPPPESGHRPAGPGIPQTRRRTRRPCGHRRHPSFRS